MSKPVTIEQAQAVLHKAEAVLGHKLSFGEASDLLLDNFPELESSDEAHDLLRDMGRKPIRCDQCEALMINGVFCHETGCPNTHSRYDSAEDRWVKTYECLECGCRQDEGVECCVMEEYEEDHCECGVPLAPDGLCPCCDWEDDSGDVDDYWEDEAAHDD